MTNYIISVTFSWGPSTITRSIPAMITMALNSISQPPCDKRYSDDRLIYCMTASRKSFTVLKGCEARVKFSNSCCCFRRSPAKAEIWQSKEHTIRFVNWNHKCLRTLANRLSVIFMSIDFNNQCAHAIRHYSKNFIQINKAQPPWINTNTSHDFQ